MKQILGFLQNQYAAGQKDADEWSAIYESVPQVRRRIISKYICHGHSLTARRLQKAFGENIEQFAFENASPLVGTHSSSRFAADSEHMASVIEEVKPVLVVTFGKVAEEGLYFLLNCDKWTMERSLFLPHPAARGTDDWERDGWNERVKAKLRSVLNTDLAPGTRITHVRSNEAGTVLDARLDEYDSPTLLVSFDEGRTQEVPPELVRVEEAA